MAAHSSMASGLLPTARTLVSTAQRTVTSRSSSIGTDTALIANTSAANRPPAASHSGILEVTVTGRRVDDYRWRPAVINDQAQPVLTPEDERPYQALMNEWNALRSCTDLTERPTQTPG